MHNSNLRIVVVWEPILPTDWRKPTSGTLARISDPRVVQFWDPHHLVSAEVHRSLTQNGIAFNRHISRGNFWDLAALYAPAPSFINALPAPTFLDGPVVDVISPLAAKIQQLLSSAAATKTESLHIAPACAPACGLISSSR